MTQFETLLGYRGMFAEPVLVLGKTTCSRGAAQASRRPVETLKRKAEHSHCLCCSQPAALPSCLARRTYRNAWWMGEIRRHPEWLMWAGALRVYIHLPGHVTQGTRQRLRVTLQLLRGSEVLIDFPCFCRQGSPRGDRMQKQKSKCC